MKAFFSVLRTSFLTVGSIIGAGFITGRELISFFGFESFLPSIIIAGILLFFGFLIIYKASTEYKDESNLNKALFAKPKITDYAIIIATFISLSGVLSGLDLVFFSDRWAKIPLLSILVLILSHLTAKKGVKGLEIVSAIIVPVMVIIVVVMLFFKNQFEIGGNEISLEGLTKSLLYASMNVFVNLPILVSTAKNKGKKTLIFSALVSALLLSFLAVLMLSAISFEGEEAVYSDMPLLKVLGGESAYLLFTITLFSALLTSSLTAYYPLYKVAVSRGKRGSFAILWAILIVFSRLGIKTITDYFYPLIGAFGVVYVFKCTKLLFIKLRHKEKKIKYKNPTFANNDFIAR